MKIRKLQVVIVIVTVLLFAQTASSIGGNWEDWVDWGGPTNPESLPDPGCYDDDGNWCGDTYFYNETPAIGEEDVAITAKGVQTCIDLIMPSCAFTPSGWCNTSFFYRKQITLNHSQVNSTLTNFPVLINITDTDLRDRAQSDGDDICFFNSTCTKLNHEIELYNSTTGQLIAWVNVTSLSSSADTVIYMYYGNATCGSQQNAEGTWDSNYVMVQHMNDITTSTIKDSTSNNNDGTKKAANQPIQADGQIGKGQDFDGSDDHIGLGIFNPVSQVITLSAWIKPYTYGGGGFGRIFDRDAFRLFVGTTNKNLLFNVTGSSANSILVNTDYYVGFTRDASNNCKLFIDGAVDGTFVNDALGTGLFRIGNSASTVTREFDGILDEVRISNTARAAEWIKAEYNNMINATNGGFYTLDTQETIDTIQVTFQWLDYDLYFAIWLEWANAQNWFDPDNVSWATEPTWDNDSLWHTYANWYVNASQTLCAWNNNVTCYTENDWTTDWFDWRMNINFTCGGTDVNITCYYFFRAEECDINYIYPASPNGTGICPCCDCLCVNITNEFGHPMDITIFLSDNNETFYTDNVFDNTTNGSYCFCLRDPFADAWALGHTDTNQTAALPNVWYNASFDYFEAKNMEGNPSEVTVPYTGHYDFQFWVSAITKDATPNGKKIAIRFTQNNIEINGSYRELDFERKNVFYSMASFCHADLVKGDRINFQYIVNDVDTMISKYGATWSTNRTCAYAQIELADSLRFPLLYNKTYYWYVNYTDDTTKDSSNSELFQFRTAQDPSLCPCGIEELTEFINETGVGAQKDYIIGIIGIIGLMGLIGWFMRSKE